ncbi:hypothetical protein KL916_005205 [Ogataea parapolymorpha]|nr:hypothetical protein KL916_005205 [Ogataea parapolymorpha]
MSDKVAVASPWQIAYRQTFQLARTPQFYWFLTHGGAACHGVRAPGGEDGDFLATAASSVLCAKSADAGAAGRRAGVQQAQIRPVEVHAGFGDAVRCAHRPDALVAGGPACVEKHGVCPASDTHPLSGQDPVAEKVRPESNQTGPHYVVCVHYTSHQHPQAVKSKQI